MGVSVLDGDTIVGEIITNLKKNHSVRLMPAIEQLLDEVQIKPNELERIVVAEGPGLILVFELVLALLKR